MKKIKTINLFVACSSTSEFLNEKKDKLMEMCRELNVEFADKDISFTISPVSYEDLERRMEVFNKYIDNKADIVVFLIDDTLGAFLEDKLKLAAKRAHSHTKPELLVFITKNPSYNLEQRIKDILKKDGWLYEQVDTTQNMLANVKQRIKGFIGEYDNKQRKRRRTQRRIILGGVLAVVVVVFMICRIWNLNKQLQIAESPRLLIAGGGSARNYLEQERLDTTLVCLKPDFWWYVPMPSGDSYRMISEEIINLEGDYKKRPYYPIIISAEKAERDTLFRRTIDTGYFRKKGYVIGIHIGDDYLVAYGGNNAFNDYINDTSSTILETDLDNIIMKQASLLQKKDTNLIHIYTTNKNSGTLNAYLDTIRYNDTTYHLGLNSYLKVLDSLRLGYVFSSIDTLSKQKPKTKWIALGSKYYHPETISDIDSLVVLDSRTRRPIYKPIYVYFLLYKDNTLYRLPDATEEFLRKINVPTQIIDNINNPNKINEIIKKDPTTVLYDDFHVEKK